MSFLTFLFWLKSIFAYLLIFKLGIEDKFQYFILFINPLATTIFLLGLSLYVKKKLMSYLFMGGIYAGLCILLFSNIVYYREFSDFITIPTILGTKSVSAGLSKAAIHLFRPLDIFFLIDLIAIPILFVTKKAIMDPRYFRKRVAIANTAISVMMFFANLFFAESSRPELLSRTFAHDYIIKYLGINFFTGFDGYQTFKTNQVRKKASPNDLTSVKKYVHEHYIAPNEEFFGIAKNRNVIYIHLESFQKFLIDYKLKDKQGQEHEVTPFLNSLFHSQSSFSFDNFFHQVKAGKTSDAENLLENSLFGLNQGPLFTQLGGENTFQAAPDILQQKAGYTSAIFHGNSGTFWNRNETYKRLGIDYFFDSHYFDITDKNSFQYGIHDKPLFQQSVQYLEHLQQPFYSKFLTVSNHYPYSPFTDTESGFPIADTDDKTINGYFATANYLDKSIEEFFNYLKSSGLYEKSIIILYGDHFGISNQRNPSLAKLLEKNEETWNEFDDTQLQRVPLIFHIPGREDGQLNHTYGGQVDILPTLLHLLGIGTTTYLQLGQDLFSPNRDQLVAFRDKHFITPEYTVIGSKIYHTQTGEFLENPSDDTQKKIQELQKKVDLQLATSDRITTGDLLRFYGKKESGLSSINPEKYNYKNGLKKLKDIEKKKKNKSTSIFSLRGKKSTVSLYESKSYQDYFVPQSLK
ncbi:MAG: LTA synthase family protein [Lactobacillales bacterium]|nr:LTA synthase family protein [Lactobacillales bacterium]